MSHDQTLHAAFVGHINTALNALEAAGTLPAGLPRSAVAVEPPRDASHGDLATNAAMVLAKPAGTNPRALAEALVGELAKLPLVESVSIAGPGFINLTLSRTAWLTELAAIATLGADYGRSNLGGGTTVNVEYVSANPTGPMHMGHCRGAVVGDALATLLEFAGHKVIREYYVNDAGAQVQVLARSVHIRYREALGEGVGEIPEGLYPGDYLVPVGKALAEEFGDKFAQAPEAEWLALFRTRAVAAMMDMIRDDLALLGIQHDVFSSEAELQASGKPDEAEAWLRAHDLVYDGELEAPKGKLLDDWEPVALPLFRSTRFGDDQDRPIKKSDGSWTYFGADLAYHFQKAQSADALVDIWGADHAGTVKRIKAAVAALTGAKGKETPFEVKLVQMVALLRNGEPVKMSSPCARWWRKWASRWCASPCSPASPRRRWTSISPRWWRRPRTTPCSMCNMPMRGSAPPCARARRKGSRHPTRDWICWARKSWRWCATPRSSPGWWKPPPSRVSRTASPFSWAIWPGPSTPIGTSATSGRTSASLWHRMQSSRAQGFSLPRKSGRL